MLHGDGDDESTDIIDSSLVPHSPTAAGGCQIDTAQSVFGGASILFGTNKYVNVPDHIDWDLIPDHTVDSCTIDFRMRLTSRPADPGLMGVYQDASNWWGIYWNGTSFFFIGSSVWMVIIDWTPSMNTWYHIAIVHSAPTDNFIFIDGVAQTITGETNANVSGFSAPLRIGRMERLGRWMQGNLDEIRFSNIARWTENFTPPEEAYSSAPPPPPPPFIPTPDKFFVHPQYPVIKKIRTNPGFSITPAMHVPVPIKLDKWEPKNAVPARRKKKGRGRTQEIHVDFNVPTLPEVTLDKWFQQHPVPTKRFEKKIVRPSEFMFNFVEAWQVKDGNWQDTGVFGFKITKESTPAATFKDTDVFDLTITAVHLEDFQLEDDEVFDFTIKYPTVGNEVFNSGVPGFVSANVIIDGVNESNNMQGSIVVTREDNTAARFKCTLELDQTLSPPRKPAELINKVISISFAAADMDGVVADYVPIFVGLCKHVTFNDDQRSIMMTGYDYGGAHQTRGEFVSDNVTDVLTGSIYISSAGTHSLGHSPVWGLIWTGNDVVTDGEDYFINTLTGAIIVPVSSRILQFPGSFTYNYQNPFDSMKSIIENVAALKGWTLQEDNVTIADYSDVSEHPVLSLSDESIVDVCRKFLELSGAKVESNLFPELRVYSEVQNVINTVNTHTVDESKIFEDSLIFRIDFDDILNEQTTRSVQKINANVVVGSSEIIAEFSGDKPPLNPFTVQNSADSVWDLNIGIEAVLAEHRINKRNLNSISFSSSGRFHAFGVNDTYEKTITGASWNSFIDGDYFVVQLKHIMIVLGHLNVRMYVYPAVEYELTVLGSKINYGDGTIEDVKIVTAQRPIGGITQTLKGDVYENPYIETDQHCANICDAILLEHGNPYTTQFELPVYVGRSLNIGDRLDIERDSETRFSGIVKRLSYSINLQTGKNLILVVAKGVGFGI